MIVDIRKKYKDFELETAFSSKDETLAILGASGSGKSMTLKCIAGLISPDEGKIVSNGRVLYDSSAGIDLKPQERDVGYLFQSYALFPNMTVRQNVAIAYGGTPEKREKDIDALLSKYEIGELSDRYPVELSGGQQQRAALARIFAYGPQLLLLDEPFSALDAFLRENMQAEFKRIIREYDGDVVFVTHNRDEAYKIADSLVILDEGRLAAAGVLREVFAHPGNVRAARITGCKNISPIEKTGERSFYAKDWGTEFFTTEAVGDEHAFAGIRAHDLSPACEDDAVARSGGTPIGRSGGRPANSFDIMIVDEIDGLFEKDVIFRVAGGSEDLWWIADKDRDVNAVRALSIAPEAIMLLES